jgi:hypothetical protein
MKRLPEENLFTPMGSKIHSYRREGEDDVEYEVYHVRFNKCWSSLYYFSQNEHYLFEVHVQFNAGQ